MARITKKDPNEELSKFLRHDEERNQQKGDHRKVSAQLPSLQRERRRSLLTRLGSIIVICLLVICALSYYVSPYADVSTIRIYGVGDLDAKSLVRASEVKASDKVLDTLNGRRKISKKLSQIFPEVGSVKITLSGLNTLNFKVKERKVIGYVKDGTVYRKILSNGGLGTKTLSWSEVDHDKTLFIGYSKTVSLKTNLKIFNSFPDYFKNQVKMLSGNTRRKPQMIMVMKDGNVIIGNTATISSKVKYYNAIKQDLTEKSVVDLEVGAFTRPLTAEEKKAYGIS